MERIYNKLVRDKIPEIIIAQGETAITRVLNETDYKEELERKLFEECKEVVAANGNERIEELADMLEVIRALGKLENVTIEEIMKIANEKKAKRGAFNNKIFLEKVIESKKMIIV